MILDDDTLNPNGDFGMDCLAKSLGLDIDAIARKLAMIDDRPPAQCHPVISSICQNAFNNPSVIALNG